jgi:hypothetical protein
LMAAERFTLTVLGESGSWEKGVAPAGTRMFERANEQCRSARKKIVVEKEIRL